MTPRESFLFSKNGSSILMQLVLITFFIYIYIYIYIYNIYTDYSIIPNKEKSNYKFTT